MRARAPASAGGPAVECHRPEHIGLHNFSEDCIILQMGNVAAGDVTGRRTEVNRGGARDGRTGRGRGRERLRGRRASPSPGRPPGPGDRAADRRVQRRRPGDGRAPEPHRARGPDVRAGRPGRTGRGRPGVHDDAARGGRRAGRAAPGGDQGRRPGGRFPARRPRVLDPVLRRRAPRPLDVRASRTARRTGADPRLGYGRLARLLRHRVDPGPRAAAGQRARRAQ